jgi:hypothetical protein
MKNNPTWADQVHYLCDLKYKKDALLFIDAYENLMPNPSVGTAYKKAVPLANQ